MMILMKKTLILNDDDDDDNDNDKHKVNDHGVDIDD